MKRSIPKNNGLIKATADFFKLKSELYLYEVSTHSDDWAHGSDYLLCFECNFDLDENGNLPCCLALCKDNKATILREVTFKIDPVIFLPPQNGTGIGIDGKDSIEAVVQLFKLSRPLFLKFAKAYGQSPDFYGIEKFAIVNPTIEDDLGELFFDFEDLSSLTKVTVPDTLKNKLYKLVGYSFRCPYAKLDDADCILFAETTNQYDSCAIKVLRWFPPVKKIVYDHVFERFEPTPPIPRHEGIRSYGYIARDENAALHEYMMNHSRILFGKVINAKIQILGGIEAFKDGELKERYFPHCLLEFVK